MRILHIIYDDIDNPWIGGGGAVRTLEIYSRIAAQGHYVKVLCGSYPGAPCLQVRRGVIYRYVGLRVPSHILSRLGFVVGAARLIKSAPYDIVVEDVSPFSPVAAPLWARGVPVVASVQNLPGVHATRKYGPFGRVPRLVERPLLALFSNFIAVSPGIEHELRARLPVRQVNITVIPNSADRIFFETASVPVETLAGGGYILFVGRIDVYQKGLDHLIEAFDMVAERLPGVRLVIAGGGPPAQMGRLRALVAGARHSRRIQVVGPVERERAARLLRGALMLAMPSRYEAWPLTAIEAGAVGVPVVGSDVVGVRDAAPPFPEGHAQLVPPGDLHALAGAMLRLASDPDLRRRMGERGRAWARRFTWDALADQQLAFLQQVVTATAVVVTANS
jgi:glycosyltransferase involved in cell wall biosynthesis